MSKQINNSALAQYKLIQPGNPVLWIILSLILKSGIFLFKVNESTDWPNITYHNTIAREVGDSRSYIDPVENLINKGIYFSEICSHYMATTTCYNDYRMPGYGAVYYGLRQFLNLSEALNCIVVLQLILSSVSVYVLALIAQIVFKTNAHFYLTFFLYVSSSFTSIFDYMLVTESFCVASLILSIWFLLKPGNLKVNLLLSGIFLTWCVFLRPVMAPLLILLSLYILFRNPTTFVKNKIANLKLVLLFILPFILADGLWLYRNYKIHQGFYPLTTSIYYPGFENSVQESVHKFLQSYGGSIVGWKGKSEINYFVPGSPEKDLKFPEYIFNDKFNQDSLAVVKELIAQIEDPAVSQLEKEEKMSAVKNKLNRYAESIKMQQPFIYYFKSRLILLKTFFGHSGSGYLFEKPAGDLPMPALIIKIYSSFLYFTVLILGFAGSIMLLIYWLNQPAYLLIATLCLYLSLIFPFVLKMDEYRYFAPGYPIFLIAAVFVILQLFTLIKIRKP